MLSSQRLRCSLEPGFEDFVGAVAVDTDRKPRDLSEAVSVASVDRASSTVELAIRIYDRFEDVVDPETDDFYPGIVATPFQDWDVHLQLVEPEKLEQLLRDAEGRDFFFHQPVPELGLVAFGWGYTD